MKNCTDKNRIFVAQLVPLRSVKELCVSQASHNFCYNLIEGHVFMNVLSILPVSLEKTIKSPVLETVQCRTFSHKKIGKLLNVIVECWRTYRKVRKYDFAWFYNLNWHNFAAFWAVRYFSNCKACLILADHTPSMDWMSIQYWLGKTIWKSHAILGLSARTNYITHSRFECLPGIVLGEDKPTNIKTDPFFFFSGLLGDVTGLPLVLKVFSQLPEARLIISGRDDSSVIASYVVQYPNIEYVGFLPVEEYQELLSRASCCLNFRNPSLPENLNNFPSKVLEYMNWGKPVLSTMSYPELNGFDFIFIPYDETMVIDAVKRILEIWQQGGELPVVSARDVRERFSPKAWIDTLNRLES